MSSYIKIILKKILVRLKEKGLVDTLEFLYFKSMQLIKSKSSKISISITHSDRNLEESRIFKDNILISIIVPLYNTPPKYLKEMIDSCTSQTYKHWELCLADGSTQPQSTVEDICTAYQKNDSRIIYKKLENNYGISENSNEAIKMATGEYISLLDHDDLLHPSALYEVANAIEQHHPDFIYTDEATFTNTLNNLFHIAHKPDFSLFSLRSSNYICHFTTIKSSLLDKLGGFNKTLDSAQDYDLFLRAIEITTKIYHIRKILYFWRAHTNSTAFNPGSKPAVINATITTLKNHLDRLGISGDISSILSTRVKINYTLNSKPKVSIIIPNISKNQSIDIINHIKANTLYDNYDIILISQDNIPTSDRVTILNYSSDNIAAQINYAVNHSDAEYILVMDKHITIDTPSYMSEMLSYAQLGNVGLVTLPIFQLNNKIFSMGIGLDFHIGLMYCYHNVKKNIIEYIPPHSITYTHNITSVSEKFFMISKALFNKIGELDKNISAHLVSLDLGLRLLQGNYNNILTPYASVTIDNYNINTSTDCTHFKTKWSKRLTEPDQYYSNKLF